MRRDFDALAQMSADVVVVGGGIYGACCAWHCAERGLRTVLVEAGDFGGATSANSLRTLHGGLRHLQRLDWPRMREAIRARREWLRLAPALAQPMRFVLPTSGRGARGPQALRCALLLNDLVSADRNRGLTGPAALGRGELWSARRLREHFPGVPFEGANGAAVWQDALCLNTERLLLAVLDAAFGHGARLLNYARALGPVVAAGRVCGVRLRDETRGTELNLATQAVIDATGPAAGAWLGAHAVPTRPAFRASLAFNLVTRALPFAEALALTERTPEGRVRGTWFVIPWNGRSLIGTQHLRCPPECRIPQVTPAHVQALLEGVNRLLGPHRIAAADVHAVLAGLLPEADGTDADTDAVELERAPRLIDHAAAGLAGVLSVVGVKWTTAASVAGQVSDLLLRQLGRRARPRCAASRAALTDAAAGAAAAWGPAGPAVQALAARHGSLARPFRPDVPVSRAQLLHAARAELVVHLSDLVMRRTGLWLSAALDAAALLECAELVAHDLRWGRREITAEAEHCAQVLERLRMPRAGDGRQVAA